ncbi:MAG: TIGR01841 family phasin [Zoogloeaceae bacterium]|nr:TIGR01841 family phasin [Zoogloeaceae bacterium]
MTMSYSPEKFAALKDASLAAANSLATSAFANAERLTALNLNAARGALEDSVSTCNSLLAVKDPKDLATLLTGMTQPAVEKVVAYARSVYEIASQAQAEVSKLFEAQMADLNKGLAGALEEAAKSAPAGSEVAVAAVKSAIEAANTAYDNVTKAVKQVTDAVEANAEALTSAAVKTAAPAKRTKKASA